MHAAGCQYALLQGHVDQDPEEDCCRHVPSKVCWRGLLGAGALCLSAEAPGREAPAARRSSIGGSLGVGRDGEEADLWPLYSEPSVVHQAPGVPRVGVPAPASWHST